MKKFKVLIFLALISMVLACKPIFKTIYGFHDPRTETKENLTNFFKKNVMSDQAIYFFADSNAFFNFFNTKWHVPYVSIYNKNRYYLNIIEKDTCVNQIYHMVGDLSLNNNYPIDSTTNLSATLNQFETPEGDKISIDSGSKTDFYVVIQWAKFVGKLNKRDVKSWNETLNKKKDEMNIEIFNLCCDPLESWWSEN